MKGAAIGFGSTAGVAGVFLFPTNAADRFRFFTIPGEVRLNLHFRSPALSVPRRGIRMRAESSSRSARNLSAFACVWTTRGEAGRP